ncbi:hypothetical protein TSMEX_001951 [Taenia solium]|eukprot:TsM_001123500 transcript=TsM_001123500 gene=TsM_001123500
MLSQQAALQQQRNDNHQHPVKPNNASIAGFEAPPSSSLGSAVAVQAMIGSVSIHGCHSSSNWHHSSSSHNSSMRRPRSLPKSHQDDGLINVGADSASISGCYSCDVEVVGGGIGGPTWQLHLSQDYFQEKEKGCWSKSKRR